MEKIKIYLDTNMIHDLFTNQARAMKRGSEPEIPSKFAFMIDNQDKFEFITSFLTKAEITREMVAAHGMKPEVVNKAWARFIDTLGSKYLTEFKFDERIVDIVSQVGMKLRTMVNFFHLFIAKEEKAYFVSGDKQILEKIAESKVYDKLLDCIELQRMASNSVGSSGAES